MLNILKQIYECGCDVYEQLGTGHSEAVYHKAMEVELRLRSIQYSTKSPVSIYYKGHVIGYHEPDLILKVLNPNDEKEIITVVLELKATTYPPREIEKAQLSSYLRNLNTSYGVLINFPQPASKNVSNSIHFVHYGFESSISHSEGEGEGGGSVTMNIIQDFTSQVPKIDLN